MSIKDRSTGGKSTVYVFVATLPYSQLFYAEGFFNMTSQSWSIAHIHAFEYFNGLAEVLVPDNLKTGVSKAVRGEPILNEAYRGLANYYGSTIVPARVKSPKDKPSVEGSVGYITRQIIASLRYYQCFSLVNLNTRILEEVDKLNDEPFQKKRLKKKCV